VNGRSPGLLRPLALQSVGSIDRGSRRAAFLDRDGVLNEAVPDLDLDTRESPLRAEDVRLVSGAAAAARELADAGYLLVCVSNQPAAAKGKVTVQQLLTVHARVLELLAQEGVQIAASRLCPHHPHGVVPELSGSCDCRKPAPGMLLDAASSLGVDLGASWMVGDTDADIAAGAAAGCRTALIEYPGSGHKRSRTISASVTAGRLEEAVAQLLDQCSG
jgi:D-glycero-D-manno-heptose 1,7-bisphosphate phosphatase